MRARRTSCADARDDVVTPPSSLTAVAMGAERSGHTSHWAAYCPLQRLGCHLEPEHSHQRADRVGGVVWVQA